MENPVGLLEIEVSRAFETADGCPQCHLCDESSHRYIRWVLHEYVNDGSFRAKFRDAFGMCPRHWELMIVQDDALGNAILLEALGLQVSDALSEAFGIAEALSAKGDSRRKHNYLLHELFPDVVRRDLCPVCRTEIASEDAHLSTMCSMIADGRINTHTAGSRLCLAHIIKAAAYLPLHLYGELLKAGSEETSRVAQALGSLVDSVKPGVHDHKAVAYTR